jgi:hypothetical protein
MRVLGFFSAISLPFWNRGLRSAVNFVSITDDRKEKKEEKPLK